MLHLSDKNACRDQLIPAYRPAGMPEFSNRDLRFIIKFTEVSRRHDGSILWGRRLSEWVLAGILLMLWLLHNSDARDKVRRQQCSVDMQEYEGEQLRHLVHALCPGIWGQEMVKAGLLLALFGGVSAAVTPYSHVTPIRGDIHVLLCGDPGLGKSQLLQVLPAGGVLSAGMH